MRSRSSIRRPTSALALSGGASGMRLLSPLPSACLFMASYHLAGQVQVRFGTLGTDVVEHDRLAETGRLAQTHVSRHHRLEDPLLEMGPQVGRHLLREVRPV